MPRTKYDAVIEAVRYAADGHIALVRLYERRGATFSDHVLHDRPSLLDQLKAGKRLVTGQRQQFLASTFKTGKPVRLIEQNGRVVISTAERTDRDRLEAVPVF